MWEESELRAVALASLVPRRSCERREIAAEKEREHEVQRIVEMVTAVGLSFDGMIFPGSGFLLFCASR